LVVDQRLDLRRPILEILDFVKEEASTLSGVSRLVEGCAENAVLEPPRNRQYRFLDTPQGGNFVKLDAKDVIRADSPTVDQVLNYLKLQCGLPDLSRPPQNDHRGETRLQFVDCRLKRPPSIRGQERTWPALPPRIGGAEETIERWR
jgi:hypothetical protein